MEVKTVGDCLKIIDHATVEIISKYICVSKLENIREYLLEKGQSDFTEGRIALLNVLNQINSIIENQYQIDSEDLTNEYIQLKEVKVVWLIECKTEPEVDDQE